MTLRQAMTRVFGHPVTWLVVLVLAFFYKEAFLGRVFSPADLLFDFQPWNAQRPAAYVHPSNAVRSDEAFIFFPRREQIASDVAKFGLPLWQDHNFAGTPNTFSINFLGAFVYPPMWGYLFFSPGVTNTLLHIPIPLLAALCMYLLLGRLTRHRRAYVERFLCAADARSSARVAELVEHLAAGKEPRTFTTSVGEAVTP